MKYNDMTKDKLIDIIVELETALVEVKTELAREQRLQLSWAGNLSIIQRYSAQKNKKPLEK